VDSYYGAGILKSTNGGASWTNIVGPFVRTTIGALAISPSNSQILLASSRIGIYRSTDGAATWTQVKGGVGTGVLFDPTNGNIVYAAIGNINGGASNGVFRSSDGGQTFQQLTGSGSSALPASNVGRIEIAIAPSTPSTLYVGIRAAEVLTLPWRLDDFVTKLRLARLLGPEKVEQIAEAIFGYEGEEFPAAPGVPDLFVWDPIVGLPNGSFASAVAPGASISGLMYD
jgi:hypothetical protein